MDFSFCVFQTVIAANPPTAMLEGSILQQLKAAHQQEHSGLRPLNFGVYYKNTLVALCHALEDCILSCSSEPLVLAAFQRGKWYLQEADRYAELAQKSQQVVIMAAPDGGFAEHPTSQRPNVELVALDPTDPVAQEWHLMILGPTYAAMVLCQELSDADYGAQGAPTEDLERKFYGFWTFERNLVQETVQLAIAHVRAVDAALADQLTAQVQAIAATNQPSDDMGSVVARVVDYLQKSEMDLGDRRSMREQHPQVRLDNNLLSNEVQAFLRMAQLTDQADVNNPAAAAEVTVLAEAMGQLLDLPVWQINRLKLASLLHRLAPLQTSTSDLTGGGVTTMVDGEPAPCCPLVPGAQVLRTMPRMRAIATIITHLTERWDGAGPPGYLAGNSIPLESRILGLVADFQAHLAASRQAGEMNAEVALDRAFTACQAEQGQRWDPHLVETLALLVGGLKQGFSLPVNLPKIAAGLWLVDSHCGDDLFATISR